MAVDRILLHIGYPKAGSTALQRALWLNEAWLAERDVHVLMAARPQTHAQHEGFVLGDVADDVNRELAELRQDHRRWTVVVSSESFSQLRPVTTPLVAARLAASFGPTPIDAVVYVRNPLDWVQSALLQRFCSNDATGQTVIGLYRSLPRIAHGDFDHLMGLLGVARYHERLDAIAGGLGARSLHRRPYVRCAFPHGSIFRDFLEALGLDGEGAFHDDATSNPSISLEAVIAAERTLRPDDERTDPRGPIAAVRDLADDFGGQRTVLRAATLAVAHDAIADDVAALLAHHHHLAPAATMQGGPAGPPDLDLVDRYRESLPLYLTRPLLRRGHPVSSTAARRADCDGRVIVRIGRRDRMLHDDRFTVTVRSADGSESVTPRRLDGPGALFEIPTDGEGPARLELEGVRP